MYAQHFGLAREPFSIAPDPRYLFMSARHREALAHLLYGLQGGGGFVVLTGEIGAGKTTLARAVLEQVDASCQVAYIYNPKLSAVELLQTVCAEFGVEVPGTQPGAKACIDALNQHLLQSHAAGRHNVLIIDEAQNLAPEVLEQLRLLTNLETAERKLLQIVLIGQPELRQALAQPQMEQLAQRVIARYHLDALAEGETALYVRHRLGVAGARGELPFTRQALQRVHRIARGVPRRINLLCDRALLGAYARGRTRVDEAMVLQAASEVFDARPQARHAALRGWAAGLAGLGVLAGAAGLAWAWQQGLGPFASRGPVAAAASAPAGPAASSVAVAAPVPTATPASAPSPERPASGALPVTAAPVASAASSAQASSLTLDVAWSERPASAASSATAAGSAVRLEP